MYSISWVYQYGVGGLVYAGGAIVCIRAGVLDLKDPSERGSFIFATAGLVTFAVIHALFQYVFPFVG